MIIGVDIGGTKTLVAKLTDSLSASDELRFETSPDPKKTVLSVIENIKKIPDWKEAQAIVIGSTGVIDPDTKHILASGTLPWKNVNIIDPIKKETGKAVYLENDAKLAGLSEVRVQKLDGTVLYLTVSTGIGSAVLKDRQLVPALAQSEAGNMMLKIGADYTEWEKFASGHALYDLYHKKAKDIHDDAIWYRVSEGLVPGILALIATIQPDAIIIGGSIGTYFDRYNNHLKNLLEDNNDSDLVKIPKLLPALHAEKAVIYGCYEYGKDQLA
jgi:predicted NBD/HSP70 family sugar kinase